MSLRYGNGVYPAIGDRAMNPQPGRWQHSAYFFAAAAGTMAINVVGFIPHFVGPEPQAYDAFVWAISTAQSGGLTTVAHGLYRDDGRRCVPLTDGGPLRSYTTPSGVLTAQNPRFDAFAEGAITLEPGMYWIGSIYKEQTAPTTKPQPFCLGQTTHNLPNVSSNTITTQARALTQLTQPGLPTTQYTDSSWSIIGGTTHPEVGLRAA